MQYTNLDKGYPLHSNEAVLYFHHALISNASIAMFIIHYRTVQASKDKPKYLA